MLFTLTDFQTTAVSDLVKNIEACLQLYETMHTPMTTSLTAATGAGKTVMSAAVIESLFDGSESMGRTGRDDIAILWMTDSPDLNSQTEYRFSEASDRLLQRMTTIDDSFDQREFAPGRIYFLNRQKLSSTSNLTRIRNGRRYTIWQTIANTIDSEHGTKLIMFLDEAHRGLGRQTGADDTRTIYTQVIDGRGDAKPMPIVVGISATIQRFSEAMRERSGRTTLGGTVVEPSDVQASGLLKDTITLLTPAESGTFDTALLRRACATFDGIGKAWAEYCTRQDVERVTPLMVVQVPNNADEALYLELCDVISEELPGLDPGNSFANVLGEHTDLLPGNGKYRIRYASPEAIQQDRSIRILFAKEAVSTGWDCPRAEVLYSMRPGKDKTHIMQLIGRMVRTPLAMRIDGNDLLNTVACYLPKFDAKTTRDVAEYLTGNLDDDTISSNPDRRVLTQPITLEWNPKLDPAIRKCFAQLPTSIRPRAARNGIDMALDMAGKLAMADIDKEADTKTKQAITDMFDAMKTLHRNDYEQARKEVTSAQATVTSASRVSRQITSRTLAIEADRRIIEHGYRQASSRLTKEAVNAYAKSRNVMPDDMLGFMTDVAALGSCQPILDELGRRCTELANNMFERHRDAIYGLSQRDRDAIEQVVAASTEPHAGRIAIPENRVVDTNRVRDGHPEPLPVRDRHLLSLPDGTCPVDLRDLELRVLDAELGKPDTVAWYRNPSGAAKDALQIAYKRNGAWHSMQPDFVFFSGMADGTIRPSIVDPHGDWLPDALDKLKGLAAYADMHRDAFKRIEAVAEIEGTVRYLNMLDPEITARIESDDFAEARDAYLALGRVYV